MLRKFRSILAFQPVFRATGYLRASFDRVAAFPTHAIFFGLTASFRRTVFADPILPQDDGEPNGRPQKVVAARFGVAQLFVYKNKNSGRDHGFDSHTSLFVLAIGLPASTLHAVRAPLGFEIDNSLLYVFLLTIVTHQSKAIPAASTVQDRLSTS